jgi:hypothetical protein
MTIYQFYMFFKNSRKKMKKSQIEQKINVTRPLSYIHFALKSKTDLSNHIYIVGEGTELGN